MGPEELTKRIEEKAKVIRSRANRSLNDGKRHDQFERDEIKWMRIARRKLDWSYRKIGAVFLRDWRTVKKRVDGDQVRRRTAGPRLVIGNHVNCFLTDGLDFARFASVQVSASGVEARGCWGWVRVLPSGPTMPLHWRETPFKEEQTEASRIFIRPEAAAVLDVAFSVPLPATKAVPQNAAPCQEVPAFFAGPGRGHIPWRGQGCWLARPSALENPRPGLEAYLSPGKHTIEVSVGPGRGKGDVRRFTLVSPKSWEKLSLYPEGGVGSEE
jgi:hypothetical protein